MAPIPYAELHCHTNFSFLDGASPADDLVERAVELGLTGLAVTDHAGPVRCRPALVAAAEAAGLHPVIGIEIELLGRRPCADPGGVVVVPRHGTAALAGPDAATLLADPVAGGYGRRGRVRSGCGLPGHREVVKEDRQGSGERGRGRTSCCSLDARSDGGACAG